MVRNTLSPVDPADPSNKAGSKNELWADVNAVYLDKTKKITDFDPEYQEVIKNTYRFSSVKYNSRIGWLAKRTTDTLDIV